MKRKRLLNHLGFSYLEMTIVVAISTTVALAMFASSRATDEQMDTTRVRMTIQKSAREGIYKMAEEIRQSRGDTGFSFAPNPCSETSASGGTPCTQITFDVPDPDNAVDTGAGYSVNWTGAHQIVYSLDSNNNQILRTDRGTQAAPTNLVSVVANDTVSLRFTGDTIQPRLLTITIGAQKRLRDGSLEPEQPLQLSAQAELRNTDAG